MVMTMMAHTSEALLKLWALLQVLSTLTTTREACPMIFISQMSIPGKDLSKGWGKT